MSLGYTRSMRAVMLEVPEWFLEDRRKKGHDKRDEVWEGVLHMVPPASFQHNTIQRDLLYALRQIARRRGLIEMIETGVFDPIAGENNYRIPDLALVDSAASSQRGIEGGASLVVEILSPGDESREKLPFYARVGVREVWLLHPVTRVIEVFVLRAGELVALASTAEQLRSPLLDVELSTVPGPKVRIRDGEQIDEI